jgi:hypothetical protein
MPQAKDDVVDVEDTTLPPITGISDLDVMVRNARLVYIVRRDLPLFHHDEPESAPARTRRDYVAVTTRLISVMTGMVRELVPDTVVGENHLESAPAGSISFASMKLFDTKDETAHEVFKRYFDDSPAANMPKLLFMFDDRYSDGIARRADVVMDMRVYAGDWNLIQLTDLTHRSGRRQLVDLNAREFRRMPRLNTVDVTPVSHGIVRIRTSSTDRLVNISKLNLLELQGQKLAIHIGDQKLLIQNHVEACLVYNKINHILGL